MGGKPDVPYPNVVVDGIRIDLDRDRLTIGKDAANDIVVADATVSRTHAVIEVAGHGHTITDLGSRNGTTVNGERIFGPRILRPGDDIRLGRARVLYTLPSPGGSETLPVEPAPEVTPRERDVLVELCRPIVAGSLFTEPASATAIAGALYVSEAAVRMHLSRLYRKFGVDESAPSRRALLATAAIDRGVVTSAALRAES